MTPSDSDYTFYSLQVFLLSHDGGVTLRSHQPSAIDLSMMVEYQSDPTSPVVICHWWMVFVYHGDSAGITG